MNLAETGFLNKEYREALEDTKQKTEQE